MRKIAPILLTFFLQILLSACNQSASQAETIPTLIPTAFVPTEVSGLVEVTPTITAAVIQSTLPVSTSDITLPVVPSTEPTPAGPDLLAPTTTPVPQATFTPAPVVTAPDDSWILFLERSNEHAPVTLYAISPDGGKLVVLAQEFDNGAQLLDSTMNGEWVLLSSPFSGTYLLKLDGSQQQLVLDSRAAHSGAWSPDERHLLLAFDDGAVIVDATTGQGTNLPLPLTFVGQDSPQPGHVDGAGWSPDGSWVAVQQIGQSPAGLFARGLYRYTLASGTLETIFERSAMGMTGGPIVSPDGQMIYTGSVMTNNGLIGWPIGGGEPVTLFDMSQPLVESPRWSPDGTWAAVIYGDDVHLLKADGSTSQQLTFTDELAERQLAWSPDGQYLTGVAYHGEQSPQLFRLEVATGHFFWLAQQNPALIGLDQHNPQWLAGTTTPASSWHELANVEVPPIPLDAPTPPAEIVLNPPPLTMDPPWWGNVFFYRRQITLSEPLPLPASPFALPTLVQVSFPTSLIWEQLAFGEYQRDLRLVWWGGPVLGWRELNYEETGLEGEILTMTFPLQVGPAGETGAYYLYYGALGPMASRPDGLSSLNLRVDPENPDSDRGGYFIDVLPLGDPQELENTVGAVSWPIGWQNRPVLELGQPDSQASGWASFSYSMLTGTFQLWVRPQANNPAGVILAANTDLAEESAFPGTTPTPPAQQPFLTYDGQAFHLLLAGQELIAPYSWQGNTWHQIVATWESGGKMQLWVNGQRLGEITYTAPELRDWLDYPVPFLRRLAWGAAAGQPAIPGQYANFFMFMEPLQENEIQRLYQGQVNVQATLADEVELAVTQATIGPEGGWLRSPDGRGWAEFTPGAVTEPTTMYWVAYNPSGEGRPDHLQRYMLVSGEEWRAYTESIETFEAMSLLASEQAFQAPVRIYHQYDPLLEIAPWTVIVFRWNEVAQEWQAYPTFIDKSKGMALCLEVWHSGSFTIADNYGLGFPPSIHR